VSEENTSLVMSFHSAYNEKNLDAALDACAEDIRVWPDRSVFPEAASLVGREEFRDFLQETWSAWTSGAVTPQEVIDMGDGRVLVRADWIARGSVSGAEVSTNLSAIYTVRDGMVSSASYFFDHHEALNAAGLGD
jgi:ketosteroid isomerase-like protein